MSVVENSWVQSPTLGKKNGGGDRNGGSPMFQAPDKEMQKSVEVTPLTRLDSHFINITSLTGLFTKQIKL